MPLGGLPGKGAEALLFLMRKLAQRPRDLLKLLHRQIWVALIVAACLEEEGGVQHGVHEVLVHARGRYRPATSPISKVDCLCQCSAMTRDGVRLAARDLLAEQPPGVAHPNRELFGKEGFVALAEYPAESRPSVAVCLT